MTKFALKGSSAVLPTFINVNGPDSEKKKLIKHLTITNKSVAFQLHKAKERFKFWVERQSAAESVGGDSVYFSEKVAETRKIIKDLEEELKTEYYSIIDDQLIIPAGFYYFLSDVDSSVVDGDIKPVLSDWMRDYQKEAVTTALQTKRSTIVAATGLGKSVIILGLVKSLVAANKRVMVTVPTDYLVGQLFNTLSKEISSITASGGGRKTALGCMVLVTTMQSALKNCDYYDAIILDECHYAPTNTIQEIFMHAENCQYSYAVTATPFRSDGLDIGIHAFCGPIVFRRDVRWAISSGWLANPSVWVVKTNHQDKTITDKTPLPIAYGKMVGHRNVLQLVKKYMLSALAKDRKTIVIFKTLSPAKKLQKMCEKEFPFEVANGTYKKPLQAFANGECNLLVGTTKLIAEGLDFPEASVLIVVTQHSSPVNTYQSVGRVLRKHPNKPDPIIVDIACVGFEQFRKSCDKRFEEYQAVTNNITIIESKGG